MSRESAVTTYTIGEEARKLLALQRPTYARLDGVQSGRILFAENLKFLQFVRPYLPPAAPGRRLNILDIGCGVGASILALHDHYGESGEFWGLDKTEMAETIFYGFEKEAAAYNDMAVAKQLLLANGIAADRLHLVDIRLQPFPRDTWFDVIVSTISWGFHYPIDVYLADVEQATRPGAIVLIDHRSGTGGEALMERQFEPIHTDKRRKSARIVWRRRAAA